MMQQEITLQDLIRQNGPLNASIAAGYISQIADELQNMHDIRRICHLDVRPATIMILPDGKATLKASPVSQSYSEEGAAIDSRDLKAVHRYLLTGKKENGGQTIGPNQLQQSEPPLQKKAEEKKEAVEKEGVEKQKAVEKKTDIKQPGSKSSSWPVLVAICSCAVAAALFVLVLKNCQQKSHVETATRSYADFVWQGQWKNGKPNGEGVARYHDGRIYRGKMVKGVRKDKDARFTYADGNEFTGEFSRDTIREGKVTISSGEYYFVGKFSNGAPYDGYWYRSSDNHKVEKVEKGKETLL